MARIELSKRFAIFDLDNCLSNDEPRIRQIDWRKPGAERYQVYHQLCGLDKPADDAVKLVEDALMRGLHPIFFTGRPESVRAQTSDWIEKTFGFRPYALMMRPTDDDPRHAAELKRWMLQEFLAGEQTSESCIIEAWDDRHDVLQMYREFGITAHHKQLHSLSAYCPNEEAKNLQAKPEQSMKWLKGHPDNAELDARASVLPNAADILSAAAATFRERNAVYGSNYLMIKKLVDVLFPQGVPSALVHTDRWHLFELMLVKLSRFAISSLTHQDSIRDLTVYGAMVEAALPKEGEQ